MLVPDAIDDRTSMTFAQVFHALKAIHVPIDDAPNQDNNVITVVIPIYSFELTFILPHTEDNLILVDKLVKALLGEYGLVYTSCSTSYFKRRASVILELEG